MNTLNAVLLACGRTLTHVRARIRALARARARRVDRYLPDILRRQQPVA